MRTTRSRPPASWVLPHDRDAPSARARFLLIVATRRHGELHLDGRRNGDDVPLADGVVIAEIPAARVRIGARAPHLTEGVDGIGAHGEQRSAGAIVEVEVVEGRLPALSGDRSRGRLNASSPGPPIQK